MKKKIITRTLSPLRYPGSKKKLATYIHRIIDYNKYSPSILVEPFVGGGSVSLYFLFNEIVDKVIISDNDRLVYSFWHTVFYEPESLIKFIKKVKVNLKNFNKYKRIAIKTKGYSKYNLAKACLFLNRTSFSGILKNETGPIGGKSQKSEYKINCRFRKKELINKIRLISNFREKVIVLPYDWNATLRYIMRQENRLGKGSKNRILFYLDPPFYYKGSSLYRKYFKKNEHRKLCRSLFLLKKYKWILSYDNTKEIKKMYSRYKSANMHIDVPYSINSHAKRLEKELIITPFRLPKLK